MALQLLHPLPCICFIEAIERISKKLSDIFKFSPENGIAFFSSYGAEVRPMWKDFGDLINNYSDETKIEEPIVNASHETYHKFNNWLTRLK